ncbi:hypothetical protein DFH06DRAFT_354814 [Mycena polygramma]|nr:hypothetical protein DFH06DRAFT_354814 [Mycena polygramma]
MPVSASPYPMRAEAEYGLCVWVGYSQFIAILYAINTCYMVSTLIPHTTQKDNDPVNRLNKQFVIINFLLLCWILSVGLVPLTVGAGITHTLYPCAAASFLSPKCLAVGLDMGLPFALIATRASPLAYPFASTLADVFSSLPSSPLPPSFASSFRCHSCHPPSLPRPSLLSYPPSLPLPLSPFSLLFPPPLVFPCLAKNACGQSAQFPTTSTISPAPSKRHKKPRARRRSSRALRGRLSYGRVRRGWEWEWGAGGARRGKGRWCSPVARCGVGGAYSDGWTRT